MAMLALSFKVLLAFFSFAIPSYNGVSGKFAKSLAAELKVAACFTNFHRIREDTQGIVTGFTKLEERERIFIQPAIPQCHNSRP